MFLLPTTYLKFEGDASPHNKMRELEPIIKYKMDPVEAKAYKIALIWQDECRREISGEPYAKLNNKSDPRKSLLFKYCFKMAKETSGILSDQNIQLYIRSQIQVLKSITDGRVHAMIEPHCLVGDKAWRRWKLWKSRHDRKMARPLSSSEVDVKPTEGKMKAEIASTMDFMSRNGCTDEEEFTRRIGEVQKWINSGEVSCFWVVLSPWITRAFEHPSKLDFDYFYYRSAITPKVEEFFRECFGHEFEKGNKACQRV